LWDPPLLKTLQARTACYGDGFTFLLVYSTKLFAAVFVFLIVNGLTYDSAANGHGWAVGNQETYFIWQWLV
jgi:hypothetical protein